MATEHIRSEDDSLVPVNEKPEEVVINDTRAYRCTFETYAPNANETYTIAFHLFVSPVGHPYDYVATTTFPKNNELEGHKVEQLVESFTFMR